jgi:hypothetical protein
VLDGHELVAVGVQGEQGIAQLAGERDVGRGVPQRRPVGDDAWRIGQRSEVRTQVEPGLGVERGDLPAAVAASKQRAVVDARVRRRVAAGARTSSGGDRAQTPTNAPSTIWAATSVTS